MIKEFDIQGCIKNLPSEMTEEEFWHKMIGFIEKNGWLFGGGLEMKKISGCISQTSPDMTLEKFSEIFHAFLDGNGWYFEGEIKMLSTSLMDILDDELTEKKSLGALIYLIDLGHELEFSVGKEFCFISHHQASKAVSLWIDGKEQSFNSMSELLENALIGGQSFLAMWEKAKIEFLF